jgi:hypothetical protein
VATLSLPVKLVSMLCLAAASGCTSSTTRGDAGAMDGATRLDAGGRDASIPDTGGDDAALLCVAVTCEIACMFGFARDDRGCEICECAVAPDDSCVTGSDCTLARDATGCCGCRVGYAAARVDREPCLVRDGEPVPPGCLPDPGVCATVDCKICEPFTGASCASGGVCIGTMD